MTGSNIDIDRIEDQVRIVDGFSTVLAVDARGKNAAAVAYDIQFATVADALDALLYRAPELTTFTASPAGPVELGSAVPAVTLAWSITGSITTASVAGLSAIPPNASSISATGPFTQDTSWTLTVGDGKTQVSATAELLFRQKVYWGVSPSTTLTSANILAMSGEFATSVSRSLTYDCTGGAYPYVAYPASWGTPTVSVGGITFSDLVLTAQDFVNASGHTSPYMVARFGHLQNGSAIPVTWS